MKLPLYQVDAFARRPFRGNPAAVCPLDAWLDDATMQAIAAENNLAETAFFAREPEGYRIRWFTPEREVDLCGHATLASAFVLFRFLAPDLTEVAFQSRSGPLSVRKDGDRLTLDFPARPPGPALPVDSVAEALGREPGELYEGHYRLAVCASEDEVRALRPRMDRLASFGDGCLIVTAPGSDCDFVSRFFAPAYGLPEDPVTGSAHCTLAPYWAGRLGKSEFFARQISARGGELWVATAGNRVLISGHAALYLTGQIDI